MNELAGAPADVIHERLRNDYDSIRIGHDEVARSDVDLADCDLVPPPAHLSAPVRRVLWSGERTECRQSNRLVQGDVSAAAVDNDTRTPMRQEVCHREITEHGALGNVAHGHQHRPCRDGGQHLPGSLPVPFSGGSGQVWSPLDREGWPIHSLTTHESLDAVRKRLRTVAKLEQHVGDRSRVDVTELQEISLLRCGIAGHLSPVSFKGVAVHPRLVIATYRAVALPD